MDGGIYEKSKNLIIDSIKNSHLKNYIELEEIQLITKDDIDNTLNLFGRAPKSKSLDIEEFRENLFDRLSEEINNQYATQFIEENFKIECGMCVGDKFQGIDVYDDKGKKYTITHKINQTIMIDFWATWCGFCQEPMQENINLMTEEMRNRNISIIGISCDEDSSLWINHINEKKWNSIEQYVKPTIRKDLDIKGIPCIMIISKEGIIKYIGHPNKINIEKTLINLTEDRPIVKMHENYSKNKNWENVDLSSRIKIVKEINNSLYNSGLEKSTFCVRTYSSIDELCNMNINRVLPAFYGKLLDSDNETLMTLTNDIKKKYEFDEITNKSQIIKLVIDEDF